MRKKEISEIRRQYAIDSGCFSIVYGCYVDAQKNKLSTFRIPFGSIMDEEAEKYLDLLKKGLSGKPGITLFDLSFEGEEERNAQETLLKTRDMLSKNGDIPEEFFDQIIESFFYEDNYLILVAGGAYDVPAKNKNDETDPDNSDEIYTFFQTVICPVLPDKPALSYDQSISRFRDRDRDFLANNPIAGFLFPAFTDRCADVNHILYYAKKAQEPHIELVERFLGSKIPSDANTQQDAFLAVMDDVFQGKADVETVLDVCEAVRGRAAAMEAEEQQDPIAAMDLRKILERSGATSSQMQAFEKSFEENVGENGILEPVHLIPQKEVLIASDELQIRMDPERAAFVRKELVNGAPCLIIPVSGEVLVNGIRIS